LEVISVSVEQLKLSYFFENTESFAVPEVFEGVEYPWEALEKATQIVEERVEKKNLKINEGTLAEGSYLHGNYSIGKGTQIHSQVTIEGPVIIGENVTIQSGALVRPYTIIGNNCVIGHGCEVKHAIVGNGAKVQSFTFAGDSVIGQGARVGSGTIIANRRFDQGIIGVKVGDTYTKFDTDFFGCVLGDFSRIGANSATLPGTCIGPYTWVFPLMRVHGFVPKETRVSTSKELEFTPNKKMKLKP
jgi:bifunctional UDP-N-acetylglucosamine pyrophosphorylase/glucosamine-1-phosphate N-acetyltransferase